MAVFGIGQVWADPAAVGTTLFSEDFSGYAKDAVPSGEVTTATGRVVYGGANVTYSVTNGSGTTKIYTENSAGGTSPEILVGKSNGTLTIAGIPSGSAKEITVSYKQNKQKLKVESTTTGYSGSKDEKPSSVGANSVDITIADGSAETFTLVFTCTGSSNVRVDDILVTVKTAGEGAAPAKTLTSIAVSGAPTKTSYYAGDNFDPAGLTVTGTYSDASTAPITSGITWSYNPSQTLALNQTSIGVTATVSGISSEEYNVAGLSVTDPVVSNWQVVAPADLVTGDVVVLTMLKNAVYYAAPNNGGTNAPTATAVAVVGDKLSNDPAETLQWEVTVVSDGVYQFSVGSDYLKCTDTNNGVKVGTGDYNTFDVVVENEKSYLHTTETMSSASNGRYLGIYNTQDWRCYGSVNNNIKDGSLVIFKSASAAPAVNKPTISGDEHFVTSTSVSMACTTSGADIYYTLNGSDPKDGGATLYEGSFSLTEDATVNARAKLGDDWSGMVSKTFTKVTALTTMDAIFAAASTAGNYYITFSDSWVVTGVSTNGKNVYITDGTKGMILFNNSGSMGLTAGNTLSGTVERSLKLYNGAAELDGFTTDGLTIGTASLPSVQELDAEGIAGLSGVNTGSLIKISGECTEESSKFYIGGVQLYNSLYAFSVSAGTSYECTGVYVQYNSTKEILPRSAEDIVVSSSVAVTGIDLTESTASVEVGETVTLHASVVPSTATNKTIVWSVQSGSDKASVADGVVTGLAAGEAVIRAASDEDATLYDECTVTVTAADPTKHVVTFDATVDKTTEATELSITKGDLTIAVTEGDGRFNNGTDYRPYKNAVFTVSCSSGNITKIEFTCTSSKPITGFADLEGLDKANEVWTGNAPSVSFTASGAQVQMTQLVITYKEDNRAEAGLAWNPADDIEITVGDAFSAPALNNPNSIDAAEISIESSNTSLATVTAGVVALVTDATGEATITATFAGNATYKPATISYKITVNGAPLTDYYEKVTSGTVAEGTYLIVYEEGSLAFNGGLATLDAESNTIAVDITSDNKIAVTSATEAAAFYIDPTAGTVKSASGNFIGVGSWSNGLKQDKEYAHNVLEIDGDGNAQIGIYNADWNTTGGTMRLQYNKSSGQTRFRYYKNGGQQPIALYKLANEVVKPAAGLAWDPADDIELTVGDAFTAPTLLNPNNIDAAEITIESSNTDVATVTAGVVALVADATGTTTITATFAGNASYKPATVSYKIKVNPANSIYVSPSLNVNFGSVEKDAALPDDKTITVTLNNVAAATATLGGTNPEAFSIDPATLTASGDITISVVSSATVGEFKATLTISDDASVAASKEVKLSFTVTEPSSEETPISTSTKWVAATEIADGMQVLITGVKDEVVYAMGEQKSTNRAAYVATIDGEGVLTPGEGTMAFTLVAQGDGTYAIRTSNGKYLYAAKNDANHLKTQDEVDVNAKWTLTVASAVAASSTNRNVMQFNGGSSKLFSCYASASQSAIQFYVPKPVTPPTPVYETVREGLTAGNYYTICYPKAMKNVQGATLWSFVGRDANFAYIEQETATTIEAGKPYILYATAATVQAELEGDNALSAGSNGALHGTFTNLVQENLDGFGADVYLVIGNQLRLAVGPGTGSNTLPAYRAYVKLSEISDGTPAPMPGRQIRSMSLPKNTPTGMDQITNDQLQMSNKVIINGHLYIIRGEKMYDATGRLVK